MSYSRLGQDLMQNPLNKNAPLHPISWQSLSMGQSTTPPRLCNAWTASGGGDATYCQKIYRVIENYDYTSRVISRKKIFKLRNGLLCG